MNQLLLVSQAAGEADVVLSFGQAMAGRLKARYTHHSYEPGKGESEVIALARKEGSDLIVALADTQHNLLGKVLGPTGISLLPKAPCPVLLLPAATQFSGFKHIVYATRFEERDYRIPPYLEALAQRCEARLSVVFVSRKLPEDRFPSRNPILEQVYRMETEPSNVFFYNLYHRDVVAGINLFITSYPTDLLALLPRRRPAYAMRLGSSLTRSLAGKVKIPLLAVMD